ncbi:RTA1 like protein [Aaosphaeria arxii CBS 175.79]|uniref:RTA1 like protein n=1 Tax=Aaosphaeria arxii CBS 175.79 TaxID=1450172 RepID=A0A6A5XI93_9PLEO|nr:RTA1 like protein [Aaosphaeria arxii CBS 175.79]KAF2012586.1 RTA1 like protein [Aaosphaeria arxii CBS 175.79]
MAGEHGIYKYEPNKIACIAAAGLFGASALIHLFQMIRSKAWFYTSFCVGAIMMTAGYVFRYISANDPSSLGPYIGQSLCIILPPSLYAATIYMIYGRLVLFVDAADASVIRPTRVTKIFVIGDVFGFLLQSSGGGMMAQSGMADMGQKIMLIGLFVQLLFLGFFLFISLIFWKRMNKSTRHYTVPQYGKHGWKALLKMVVCAAVIIIARCVFRVIEFAQGHDGYLVSHEIYMYIFDSAPMFLVQAMMHFVYAAKVFGIGNFAKLGKSESVIELNQRGYV